MTKTQTTLPIERRIIFLEAARGIASMLVVLYHVARHLDKNGDPFWLNIFQFGHAGVDLFFVISGFIILHVHYDDIGHPERLWLYAKRRLTRIYPTYWVALIVTLIIDVAGQHNRPHFHDILLSATLLPFDYDLPLGIAWTLQFEIFFYIFFALFVAHQRSAKILISIWLLSLTLQLFHVFPKLEQTELLLSTYNFEFLFGMGVALFVRHVKPLASKEFLLAGGTLFLICALLENFGWVDGYAGWMRLPYGFASALLITGCATLKGKDTQLPSWLSLAGSASYSIYLFQFVFIGIVWKLCSAIGCDGKSFMKAAFFLLSAAGILGGMAISIFLEKPLIDWVRSVARK